MRVHVFSSDLFFVGRLTRTLARAGHAVTSGALLDAASEAAIIDVGPTAGPDWDRHIQAARRAGVPVAAFGPHHDAATLRRAKDLGADVVVANQKIMRDPASVLDALRLKGHPEGPSRSADGQGDQGPEGSG